MTRPQAAAPTAVDAALEWFRKHFDAEAAADVSTCYAFRLAGEGGGSFRLDVTHGRLETRVGPFENADVVFSLSATDWLAILDGSANPDLLFMEDRLVIQGDLSLALRLRRIFRRQA